MCERRCSLNTVSLRSLVIEVFQVQVDVEMQQSMFYQQTSEFYRKGIQHLVN